LAVFECHFTKEIGVEHPFNMPISVLGDTGQYLCDCISAHGQVLERLRWDPCQGGGIKNHLVLDDRDKTMGAFADRTPVFTHLNIEIPASLESHH
jgi:hypothetical protein